MMMMMMMILVRYIFWVESRDESKCESRGESRGERRGVLVFTRAAHQHNHEPSNRQPILDQHDESEHKSGTKPHTPHSKSPKIWWRELRYVLSCYVTVRSVMICYERGAKPETAYAECPKRVQRYEWSKFTKHSVCTQKQITDCTSNSIARNEKRRAGTPENICFRSAQVTFIQCVPVLNEQTCSRANADYGLHQQPNRCKINLNVA